MIAALGMVAMCVSATLAAPKAELSTYQRADGQTFYALNLTPDAVAAAERPSDVVILFDTSASQTGVYRETALAALEECVAKLRPEDRVQLLAVDLEARPLTDGFLLAHSQELQASIEALRRESPLGSTDMERVLDAAVACFDSDKQADRALLYIGDGMSTANLLGTETFSGLVKQLRDARIPVSSYAIGPRLDGRLLAALANQTGGNLFVAEPLATADAEQGVSLERASQENDRRGAAVGAKMADWTHARVLWPKTVAWPKELGDVYPSPAPPLRSDRDTVVVGATDHPLQQRVTVELKTRDADNMPVDLQWTVSPSASDIGYSYLSQVVDMARADGGVTLPTVGSPGLAETGRLINSSVDDLTAMAERAVAMGDVESADLISQAVLRHDPGNVQAKTVQQVIRKPADEKTPARSNATSGDELNLVRAAQADAPPQASASSKAGFPADGSLTDRFAEDGAFLDEVESQKHVFSEMLRKEVENTVVDARREMSDEPDQAAQRLKLALQNVDRATELGPEVRAQLIDKLQVALREVQRAAAIKDELDAQREEAMAAARERRMLNDRLARQQEKEKQLLQRFIALIDERRYNEALDVASIVEETDPEGVAPRVAAVWGGFKREYYLQEVVRAARWRNFSDTLYMVELSSVPFPDEPPIVYPAAPVWEDLTNRRKKYAAVDLKSSGGADEKINEVLSSPLKSAGLEFTVVPLEEVVASLQDEYDIPVQIDTPALDDVGLSPDEPVSINLHNVTLRSALRLMLKQLELTYVIRDEVLMITTQEEAETELVVKVYPVADLVLPIELPNIGGGGLGGGLGGGGGGGLGGGGGGFGGGGGGLGGGGGGFGGGGGGGGGGFFSVPDQVDPSNTTVASVSDTPATDTLRLEMVDETTRRATANSHSTAAIEVDESVNADLFWDRYFSDPERDPAAVRQTVRVLMGKHQVDQVIALIQAALRNGQPQPWMYESLGIAMELAGKSKPEIERAVMSAADFSTSAEELMYIAQYLSRLGLDRRALQLYQQVVKLQPLRYEAYALGLRAAEKCDDLAGVQWATVGILSQAWTKDESPIQDAAMRVAKATLQRLADDKREADREALLEKLQEAVVRDCVVRVSWTGEADVDVSVEEPSGSICSLSEPRTAGGGVWLGDAYSRRDGTPPEGLSEIYVCPRGFPGTYRVKIHRVWGEVTAGKVTVDVYTHLRGDQMQHERQQLDLGDKDTVVVFDLNAGRRSEPLETAQLATAFERQKSVSRAVLAQELDGLSDDRAIPGRADAVRFRRRFLGSGGAVGYQPIIQTLSRGTTMFVSGVVSADRRYVRISPAPMFTGFGNVQTFTFAGAAEPQDQNNGGTDDANVLPVELDPFNEFGLPIRGGGIIGR